MAESPPTGQWVSLNRPLYMLDAVTCCTCGEMIPSRYWDGGTGLERPYCSPDCQILERRVAVLRVRWATDEDPFRSRGRGRAQA